MFLSTTKKANALVAANCSLLQFLRVVPLVNGKLFQFMIAQNIFNKEGNGLAKIQPRLHVLETASRDHVLKLNDLDSQYVQVSIGLLRKNISFHKSNRFKINILAGTAILLSPLIIAFMYKMNLCSKYVWKHSNIVWNIYCFMMTPSLDYLYLSTQQ